MFCVQNLSKLCIAVPHQFNEVSKQCEVMFWYFVDHTLRVWQYSFVSPHSSAIVLQDCVIASWFLLLELKPMILTLQIRDLPNTGFYVKGLLLSSHYTQRTEGIAWGPRFDALLASLSPAEQLKNIITCVTARLTKINDQCSFSMRPTGWRLQADFLASACWGKLCLGRSCK
jgi:hypothetical protein